MSAEDNKFMERALELAALGLGKVSPNPMVGCVIVHEGKIIAEGWHREYGGPHAEVIAIENTKDKSLLPESTVYVTLEPCSHYGKTPPCADLLVYHGVRKVVICNLDINPLVAGGGIKKLKDAGIQVEENVLPEKGEEINRRFFTFHRNKRPYVILKWAQTADGFIARKNYDSKWISNELSRKLVHKWRSEEDAVLVGTNTAIFDNPSLNVRDWKGKNPVRVVIDRNLRLPKNLNLFNTPQPVVIYNLSLKRKEKNIEYVKLPSDEFLKHLLHDLYLKNIQSIIVEGGSIILNQFIENDLWDEARVFVSPKAFGEGIAAPMFHFSPLTEDYMLEDKLNFYFRNRTWQKNY